MPGSFKAPPGVVLIVLHFAAYLMPSNKNVVIIVLVIKVPGPITNIFFYLFKSSKVVEYFNFTNDKTCSKRSFE